MKVARKVAASVIVGYQKTLSPDHGLLKHRHPYGYCRHYPSCSEYSRIVVLRHGVVRGGLQAVWRVLRCNPFTKPSIDMPK